MDLFCFESLEENLRKAGKDPVIFNDNRVIKNLLHLEKQYIPSKNYFLTVQKDIKPFMRKTAAIWMLEVCEDLKVEEQVFPVAVNYLDRFLCKIPVCKRHLQLTASICLMIALKIRQCRYIGIKKLCFYTDHTVTPDDMKKWELRFLEYLQWNVATVTAFDFVDHILSRVSWDAENPKIRKHASTLIHICCTEEDFIRIPPSITAAACICVIVGKLKMPVPAIHSVCHLLNLPGAEDVELVIRKIEAVLEAEIAVSPPQQSQSPQKGTIANSSPPRTPSDTHVKVESKF